MTHLAVFLAAMSLFVASGTAQAGKKAKSRCAQLDDCNFHGACNTMRFFCECFPGYSGSTCAAGPQSITPGRKAPGGVKGTGEQYYKMENVTVNSKVFVTTTNGKVDVFAAIGYVPQVTRLQFGDDTDVFDKQLLIDTDTPDIAAVQDLFLYITVKGRDPQGTADFEVWVVPGHDEGPIPGLTTWAGVLVIVLCCLMSSICGAFAAYVYKYKRDRISFARSTGAKRKRMPKKTRGPSQPPMFDDDTELDLNIKSVYGNEDAVPLEIGAYGDQFGEMGREFSGQLDRGLSGDFQTAQYSGGAPTIPCGVCGQLYATPMDLNMHIEKRGHYGGDQGGANDIVPLYQEESERELQRPGQATYTGAAEPTIPCLVCGQMYATQQDLAIHIEKRGHGASGAVGVTNYAYEQGAGGYGLDMQQTYTMDDAPGGDYPEMKNVY